MEHRTYKEFITVAVNVQFSRSFQLVATVHVGCQKVCSGETPGVGDAKWERAAAMCPTVGKCFGRNTTAAGILCREFKLLQLSACQGGVDHKLRSPQIEPRALMPAIAYDSAAGSCVSIACSSTLNSRRSCCSCSNRARVLAELLVSSSSSPSASPVTILAVSIMLLLQVGQHGFFSSHGSTHVE